MKILLVEDDVANREAIKRLVRSKVPSASIDWAGDRESAERLILRAEYYDLILLDLSIPASPAQPLAHDISHGLALLEKIRVHAPAAIIRVVTGYPQMDMASDYQNKFTIKELLGVAALRFISKANMLTIGDVVLQVCDALTNVDGNIELDAPGLKLSRPETRVLAQLGLAVGAVRENVSQFSSGLSGARSFRLDLFDTNMTPCGQVFAKVDSLENIDIELTNYKKFVAPQLGVGTLPHLAGDRTVFYDRAGLFYRLAHDYPYNLFSYLARNSEGQGKVISELEAIGQGWLGNALPEPITIESLFQKLGVDMDIVEETLNATEFTTIRGLLNRTVRFRHATQHSDLHGENVLVTINGEPLLIDFGRVGLLPAPADAVMLELSFALHPGAAEYRSNWPLQLNAEAWATPQEFAAGSPFEGAIVAARAWATRVVLQGSTLAIPAIALAYALWQMKFPKTDRNIARAIAMAAARALS